MRSGIWPAIIVLCLCIGVGTLYVESGPSSLALSSQTTETAIRFNDLKEELSQVTGPQESSLVSAWKARAELLALNGMPLTALASIYNKLLSFEFTDTRLRIRIESANQMLERLQQMQLSDAVQSLGETLAKLARARTLDQKESIFGELEALEIYFYRQYKSDPRKVEALFFAGKAGHARYFQGIEYLEEYLVLCEKFGKCAHKEEAEGMRDAHLGLIEKFE